MQADRAGRFKAQIIENGVNENGPNKLACAILKFQLTQEHDGTEFVTLDETPDITGYFYLEKKDGTLNENTIKSLKEATGWDGRDPMWLQDTDLSQVVVQVTLEFEDYQGKRSLKVKWLNPGDSSPTGVSKANETTRKTLGQRLGSKLRAIAGGSPATPPRPTGTPTLPKTTPATPPKPARTATMEEAWTKFNSEVTAGGTDEQNTAEWWRVLGVMFPGRDLKTLQGADWARVVDECGKHILPF